jgi:peptidoglycan/LPS O-acetylase OafA/YrhL
MELLGTAQKSVAPGRTLSPERARLSAVRRRLGSRPALDGVRAIAIVAVMGLHAIASIFRGGFFGVERELRGDAPSPAVEVRRTLRRARLHISVPVDVLRKHTH